METLEVVSFGTLSKLFCLFKDNRLKKQVAREFGLLLQWITPSQNPIKLYHQLCTLLYLEQTITPCMDLKSSLYKLFAEYPNVDLHAMGFPQGWENESLWRLYIDL